MFVDASAIYTILLRESDADHLTAKLEEAERPLTSALAIFEAAAALARESNGDVSGARRRIKRFLDIWGIANVGIGEAERELALDALDRFGKGRHPARLNMGDCFAYACARTHGVPLLFQGDDFARTDIRLA